MAKLSKGLCLDLANTFSGNIKLLANLFQCSCTAVIQSETKSKHFLLSFGKGSQNFYQLLLKKSESCCICRNRHIIILNKITQMTVLFLTDWCLQRYRFLGNLQNLTHSFYRHVHLFCNLFRGRFPSQLLKQLSGNTDQLVNGLYHVNRNTDSSCLVCNGSGDRLTDPPGSIRTELIAFSVVKFLNCLDQSKISLLDQIKEQHSPTYITLCNTDHKTQVSLCQSFLSIFISLFHFFCQFDFLFCTQKRHFADLFQIHADRILNAYPFRYRKVDLVQFHFFLIIQAVNIHIIIKDHVFSAVSSDTENIYTTGLQKIKNLFHLIHIQWLVFEKVTDFLIFQHIFFLFCKFQKLYKFLTEFAHIHFHRCFNLHIVFIFYPYSKEICSCCLFLPRSSSSFLAFTSSCNPAMSVGSQFLFFSARLSCLIRIRVSLNARSCSSIVSR